MSVSVTAVIPAYNYSRFVVRAVESVLAQSFTDLECLVVNDGSTDDTLEVLSPYEDRIRVITQVNAGLSAARNTGILNAQSEYVAFLDADDFWKPEKIARQHALMTSRPELAAVGCGWDRVDGNLAVQDVRSPGRPTTSNAENVRGICARKIWLGGSGSGVMARRAIFDDVGLFDTNLRAAEDIDMWMRIAARFPVDNVYESLTALCFHGTGSFRNATLMEENQLKVYHKAIAAWPEIFDEPSRAIYLATIYADAGGELIGARDNRKALAKYWLAYRTDPKHPQALKKVAQLALHIVLKRKDKDLH